MEAALDKVEASKVIKAYKKSGNFVKAIENHRVTIL